MAPAPSSPLLRRLLVVAGFGGLTLLTLLTSLHWLVFHQRRWLFRLADTFTESKAVSWIERTTVEMDAIRLRWPAADTNDNGLADWYEVAVGNELSQNTGDDGLEVQGRVGYVFLGERTRIRPVLAIWRDCVVAWPRNMELLVTAAAPILLPADSPAGTPPTAGPLRLQATPDGRLEFDVLLLRKEDAKRLVMTHARSGLIYNELPGGPGGEAAFPPFQVTGWALPPVPSHVEQRRLNPSDFANVVLPMEKVRDLDGTMRLLPRKEPFLVWEPLPDPDTIYILQAARPDRPDEWYGFEETEPGGPPSSSIDERDRLGFPGYHGPLIYRVVPSSAEKPVGR